MPSDRKTTPKGKHLFSNPLVTDPGLGHSLEDREAGGLGSVWEGPI